MSDLDFIRKMQKRIGELNAQVAEHAGESARYLIMGEYSLAAMEAHRAYQKQLQARAIDDMVILHG